MSNQAKPMGDQRAHQAKVQAKYDSGSELEVRNWIKDVVGEDIGSGALHVEKTLRSGVLLVQLLQKVYAAISAENKPERCSSVKLKFNTSQMPFKQMENIEIFLKGAQALGVPSNSLFQTTDLYEGRNMAMVISTILQVGTEAQRCKCSLATCGPKPSEKIEYHFTEDQLKAGQGIIGLQAGTNKCASQAGMSMGSSRHIADIKVDDMSREGMGIIGLQAGSNKGASQAGMSMGSSRHISDIKVDDMSREGMGIIGLQAGSNKGASQAGMSMGSVRHIADIRSDDMSREGQGIIGLQAGSNKGASQAGMGMGSSRHISDIKVDEMSQASKATINLQYGTSKGANQQGMSFGGRRDISK